MPSLEVVGSSLKFEFGAVRTGMKKEKKNAEKKSEKTLPHLVLESADGKET